MSFEQEGQRRDLLLAHRLQALWIEPKRLQDRRRHLLIADRALHHGMTELREGDQQRRVHVVFIEAAMLGQLRAAGEDDARIHLENDVWRTRVRAWIVELIAQRLAREYFLDAECLLIGGSAQVGDDRGRQRWIREPNERAVVGNVEGIRGANGSRGLSAADSMAFAPIDRRLAMLGADDDQRGIEQPLRFELTHESPDRLIDEIEFTGQGLTRRAENIRVPALETGYRIHRQFFAHANRLEIGAEQRGHANLA